MADLLEIDGISAAYGRIQALSEVSLKVPEGSIVALLGSNGAGKSTTLNTVSRLVPVTKGRIRFADAPAKVLEHSGELERIGVNCPRSTTLMNRLRAEGLYQGPSVRNVREAREALEEVLA